jgi:HK97 gp10 family phage protein
MKLKFRVEGLAEIEQGIKELTAATAKNVIKRALTFAGEPVAKDAAQRVPVLSGNLARSIIVGTKLTKSQRKRAEKNSMVEVYVGAGPYPHAHMVEFGSVHNAPQPFMREAIDKNLDAVIARFKEQLKSAMDKAVNKARRKAARLAKGGK